MTKVTIYTDGAAKGNPGRGGYGVVLLAGGTTGTKGAAGTAGDRATYRKELSAGYRLTTNNRMELLAVITGLEELRTDD